MTVKTHKIVVFIARPTANGRHEFSKCDAAAMSHSPARGRPYAAPSKPAKPQATRRIRELREETAVRPVEFYRLGTVETFYDLHTDAIWHSAAFFALLVADANVKLNDEHDGVRWIDEAELDRHFMWPSERPLLEGNPRDLLREGYPRPTCGSMSDCQSDSQTEKPAAT
jgi:hypothetical protein